LTITSIRVVIDDGGRGDFATLAAEVQFAVERGGQS
jgi:hypothetical protein